MNILKGFASRCGIVNELIGFLWQKRLWWLIPIVVMLILLGGVLVLGSTSIAPFIYSLF